MAEVYDAWMDHDEVPYDAWAEHIIGLVHRHSPEAETLLDLGCGTGQLLARLRAAGLRVAGVDASAAMLQCAADRLAPDSPLHVKRLPDDSIVDLGPVDVVTACFDVLNYLVEPSAFEQVVGHVAATLKPGGLFFFDLNTRHKLERIFGNYNTGDDCGEFAYVWRNRYDADTQLLTAYVTFFVEEQDGRFRRTTEVHQERWRDPATVNATLRSHGLEPLLVADGYSTDPVNEQTLRHTWLARRVD